MSVGIATAGAFAATGSLSVADAPGQVLKVSGVGPAADHANDHALSHANEHAKGLFGSTPTPTPSVTTSTSGDVSTDGSVSGSATESTSATVTPVDPSTASKDASTVKGNLTGQEISAWAKTQHGVEVVAPPAAVNVQGHGSTK